MENVSFVAYIYRLQLYIVHELFFWQSFSKVSKTREKVEDTIKQLIKSQFKSEVSEKLIPKYPLGCKRILFSHDGDYYKALQSPNVNLITDPVQYITETGIKTNESHYEADIIMLATGFDPISKKFEIIGKNQREFREHGPSYWGICYNDFPNYFMVLGPNTALGHNSVIWMGECQVNYIMYCISYMIENSVKELRVKGEKSDKWFKSYINEKFNEKVWTSSCSSWYKNEAGEIWTLWPDHTFYYWWGLIKARWFVPIDHDIVS